MAPPAKIRLRSEQHLGNITKRGNVASGTQSKEGGYKVGPIVLGFFLFVIVGSAVLQIIRTAQIDQL